MDISVSMNMNNQKRSVITRPRPLSISHSYTSSMPSSPESFSPNLTAVSTQSSSPIGNNQDYNNAAIPPLTSLSSDILPSIPRLSQGLPPIIQPSSNNNHLSSPSYTTSSSSSSCASSSSPLWMNKPPRTNWNISDKQLKQIPPLHPPIPPNNVIYIHDSSPSIVACRISSCLRKRSIIANFDDDAAVATCWSKGDNGGGEGELLLFSGAATESNNHFSSSISSSGGGGGKEAFNQKDYGSSANDLAGSYYGGGGGCVVFSIHLYRGTKRGGNVSKVQSSLHHHHHNFESEREYPYQELYNSRTKNNMSSSLSTNASISPAEPDFSNVVIVECMRIRGDTIHFHKDCKAIFASAKGDSDGLDDYRSQKSMLYHSPLVFKRMRTIPSLQMNNHKVFDSYDGYDNDNINGDEDLKDNQNLALIKIKRSPSDLTKSTFTALERVLDLLEKDRFDAQLLGVKSLTFLTDPASSGLKSSYLASLCILGSQQRFGTSRQNGNGSAVKRDRGVISNVAVIADRLHHKVFNIAMGKFDKLSTVTNNIHNDKHPNPNPNPNSNHYHDHNNREEYANYPFHTLVKSIPNDGITSCTETNSKSNSKKVNIITSQYMSTIRGYMMHALTNAFTNLIQNNDQFPLLQKPTCIEFMSKDFIDKVSEDVDGATRPPMALLGTAHEATHAIKLLHLIASYSEEGFHTVHGTFVGSGGNQRVIKKRPIMELLDKAYDAGVASHHVLRLEARVARNTLSGRASRDEF
jgi:hypothetical protein